MDEKNIIVEQAEDNSASKIGKFDSTDKLLSAYNALQSEFTKRCQLIKKLQAELDERRAQADTETERGSDGTPIATADTLPIDTAEIARAEEVEPPSETSVSCGAPDADTVSRLAEIPEVMDACISRYKQKLIASRMASAPGGLAVIVPAKRPRTLSEAKMLADELLAKL